MTCERNSLATEGTRFPRLIARYCMMLIMLVASTSYANDVSVTRLNNSNPILSRQHFMDLGIRDDGSNINGPCVIRVPDWVAEFDLADPSAVYYMYFAHHNGNYIRLAWAAGIEGPWKLFNCGANDDSRVAGNGVLDLGGSDKIKISEGVRVDGHIASPDVIVDDANQRFIMFFHGPSNSTSDSDGSFDTDDQKTMVATSGESTPFLVPPAMRVFLVLKVLGKG